jgi:hypothetical protein
LLSRRFPGLSHFQIRPGVHPHPLPCGAQNILYRSNRNNPGRINIIVIKVVVTFDVIEIHGLGDSINLVKITKITAQARVISDPADVAFEMAMVNRIERINETKSRQSVSSGESPNR